MPRVAQGLEGRSAVEALRWPLSSADLPSSARSTSLATRGCWDTTKAVRYRAFKIIEESAWSFARYRGRLVKLTGDGALIEFASAVDASAAAIEFQPMAFPEPGEMLAFSASTGSFRNVGSHEADAKSSPDRCTIQKGLP